MALILNGLQRGCLLCGAYQPDSAVAPIENFVAAEDLGLAFFFGAAVQLGLVSPSVQGFQQFVIGLILAGILIAALVVGWTYNTLVAAVIFAGAVFSARLLTPLPIHSLDTLVRTYWVGAWVVALVAAWTIAFLTAADIHTKGWPWRTAGWATVLGLTAGFGYLARSETGYLALIFSALLVLYDTIAGKAKGRKVVVWGGLALGFALPVIAFQSVLVLRTDWYNLPPVRPDSYASHGIWHNALIGLGYVPNQWGIELTDESGWRYAQRHCPGVDFVTPEYFMCMRTAFFRIIQADPWLLARNVSAKTTRILALLLSLPTALWLTGAVALALPRVKVGWIMALAVIQMAPGLLAGPGLFYIQGLLMAVVCLGAVSTLEYGQLWQTPGATLLALQPEGKQSG